jgi:hypothetical protein
MVLLMLVWYMVDPASVMVPVFTFSLNMVFLMRFRKSLPVFLLFAFFSLYTFVAIKANYLGLRVSAWVYYNTPEMIHKVIVLNGFFLYAFGNMLNSRTVALSMKLDRAVFKSHYLFWILFAVGVLMVQFGIRGETIFESGKYGEGQVQGSTIHEYFVLVYFILLLVAPPQFFYKLLLGLLLLVFTLKTVLYGGRIVAMEIIVLYVYYNWVLDHKISKGLIYTFSLLAYYASNVFQDIRDNPLPLLRGDLAVYFNPIKTEDSFRKTEYIMNNQGDVLQSSARFIGLMEDGFITLYQRIAGFVYMLLSVVFPSSMAPDYSNLSGYRRDLAGAGGGGLIGAYFYIWMSYAGPFIIGGFLAYFINKGFRSSHIGYKVYAVILLVMFPRWYAYNPLHIFKFCFLTVVVYQLIRLIFNTFLRKSSPFLEPMR